MSLRGCPTNAWGPQQHTPVKQAEVCKQVDKMKPLRVIRRLLTDTGALSYLQHVLQSDALQGLSSPGKRSFGLQEIELMGNTLCKEGLHVALEKSRQSSGYATSKDDLTAEVFWGRRASGTASTLKETTPLLGGVSSST